MQAISGKYLSRAVLAFASASLFGWPAAAAQTSSIPDLSGLWGRNWGFFEEPASGPGPIAGLPRRGSGAPLLADTSNKILKPAAVEGLNQRAAIALKGQMIPDPSNQCLPEPTPFILAGQDTVQILQEKDKVTLFYIGDQKVRHVPLNATHPKNITPTWQGHSVARYEGDTLVIDTVGQKVGPFSMLDLYGTPFSPSLHVIERYRLIDGPVALAAMTKHETKYSPGRPVEETGSYGRGVLDPDTSKKGLQVEITVEDPNMFTTPWSGLVTYRQATGRWPEVICAELALISANKEVEMPRADKPDF